MLTSHYLFWCRDKGIKPKALSTFSSQFALVSRSSYKKNDSYKDENGNIVVDVVDLDNVVKDERVTFIKMDIEGAEQEAFLCSPLQLEQRHLPACR